MSYTVYILKDRYNRLYIGQTKDFQKRLKEHSQGKTKSLHGRAPLVVVHTENINNRTEAVRRERYLKSGQGRAWIKLTFCSLLSGL